MPETYDELRLENQLCFPLYACAKEVVRQYRKPLDKLNLTYTQYIVMMVLWEFGQMSEGELGERIHLESGTLAPLLKRLEKAGYISRTRPRDNERKLVVSPTDEGLALKEKARDVPHCIRSCMPLHDDELISLRSLLCRLLSEMENRNKENQEDDI
ncbi:MAG: MarR family transcriptional regulator [Spirochaetales bacterium]|nr:MarR family transcriptional regulator [Spirochaetales bacterium]